MSFALGFGAFGLFFGHASWMGLNNCSVTTWQLVDVIALVLLIGGTAIQIHLKGE